MSSFLHAVNALAWRVQHKLTLHWGCGLELMLMPDLKEVISAWLVFSETLHPPCKFRLATQGSATGHEEITYTANQHMASEKKKAVGFTLQGSEATHTSACSSTMKVVLFHTDTVFTQTDFIWEKFFICMQIQACYSKGASHNYIEFLHK